MKRTEQMIPIEQAWALVAMADRINDGRYVKFVEYAPNDGSGQTNVIAYRPNRDLIRDSLATGEPAVADTDRQRGEEMAQHFQGLALTAVGGDMSDFDRRIFSLINKDEIGVESGMAYIACLGSRFRREVAREKITEVINRIGATSRYQGTIGQSMTIRLRVLAKFAGRTFMGSVVRATDGDNLYFWTSARTVDEWPDGEFTVKASVKAHGQDHNQQEETRLTRVKIVR